MQGRQILLPVLAEGLLGFFPAGQQGLDAGLGDVLELDAGVGGHGGQLRGGVGQGGLRGLDGVVELCLGGLDSLGSLSVGPGLLVLDRGLW